LLVDSAVQEAARTGVALKRRSIGGKTADEPHSDAG
jgi:hypothetical protein